MNKSPMTLQSIITDFWQSCAEVMGRVDVTIPENASAPLAEEAPVSTPQVEGLPDSIIAEALQSIGTVLADQMDRSEVGEGLKKFDQLTGQAFTHTLEVAEDMLLGRMHTTEALQKSAGPQNQAVPVMPAPVPLAQLTREAALRFAQGAGFAQTGHDEPLEKSEDEKVEDEDTLSSEEKVKKLIRLGRLKSF